LEATKRKSPIATSKKNTTYHNNATCNVVDHDDDDEDDEELEVPWVFVRFPTDGDSRSAELWGEI
jgi:hypothetical protein